MITLERLPQKAYLVVSSLAKDSNGLILGTGQMKILKSKLLFKRHSIYTKTKIELAPKTENRSLKHTESVFKYNRYDDKQMAR